MNLYKGKRSEKLKSMVCTFPGCGNGYYGTGNSCYCHEHRAPKYRKIIDADKHLLRKKEDSLKNPNQIIEHKFSEPQIVVKKCELEGCNNLFEIRMLHNTKIYPKYCECHRNEHKRNMFLKNDKASKM